MLRRESRVDLINTLFEVRKRLRERVPQNILIVDSAPACRRLPHRHRAIILIKKFHNKQN